MSAQLRLQDLQAAELLQMSNSYNANADRARRLGNFSVFSSFVAFGDTALSAYSSLADGTHFGAVQIAIAGVAVGSLVTESIAHHYERRWSNRATDSWIAYTEAN